METWSQKPSTGAAAYYNSNDLASLIGKAIDKGSNYYNLTYVPPGQKYDYSHHTISLKVDQHTLALHLVYRNTYDAVDPATIKPPPGISLATTLRETNPADPQALMRTAMGRNPCPTSTDLPLRRPGRTEHRTR